LCTSRCFAAVRQLDGFRGAKETLSHARKAGFLMPKGRVDCPIMGERSDVFERPCPAMTIESRHPSRLGAVRRAPQGEDFTSSLHLFAEIRRDGLRIGAHRGGAAGHTQAAADLHA
jgi:hypothetical protein